MKRVSYHGRTIVLTPAYHPPVGPDRGWWAHARVGRKKFYAATQHDAERLAKRYIRSTEAGMSRRNRRRARRNPIWRNMSYGGRIATMGALGALAAGAVYLIGKAAGKPPPTPLLLSLVAVPAGIVAVSEV